MCVKNCWIKIVLIWCVIATLVDIAVAVVNRSCVRILVPGARNGELAVTHASQHVIFDVIETCGTGDVREVEFDVNRRLIGSNDWFVLCRASGNRNASGCHCYGNRTYTTCAVADEVHRYSTYKIESPNGAIVAFNVIVKPVTTTTATTPTTTRTVPSTTTASQAKTRQHPTTDSETVSEPLKIASDQLSDATFSFNFIPHGVIAIAIAGTLIVILIIVVIVLAVRLRKRKVQINIAENTEPWPEKHTPYRQSGIYDEAQDPPPPPTTNPPSFKSKIPAAPRNQSKSPVQNTIDSRPPLARPTNKSPAFAAAFNQSPLSDTPFNQSASAITAISQSAAGNQTIDALAPPTGHAFHKLSALASGSEQLAFGGDQRQVMTLLQDLRSLAEDSTGQQNAATVLLNLQQRLAAFQSPGSHFHLQGGKGGTSPAQDPSMTFQGGPFSRRPQENITAAGVTTERKWLTEQGADSPTIRQQAVLVDTGEGLPLEAKAIQFCNDFGSDVSLAESEHRENFPLNFPTSQQTTMPTSATRSFPANQIGPRANTDQSQTTLEDFGDYLHPTATEQKNPKPNLIAMKTKMMKMSLCNTDSSFAKEEKSSPTPCQTAVDTYLNPVLSRKEATSNKGKAFCEQTIDRDLHALNHQQISNTEEHPDYLALMSSPEDLEEQKAAANNTFTKTKKGGSNGYPALHLCVCNPSEAED